MTNACSWKRLTLLAFAMLHFIVQGPNLPVTLCISYFLLLHSSPKDEKDTFFIVVSSEGLGGLHRTIQFSFFSISLWA